MPEDVDNESFGAAHIAAANKDQNAVGLRVQGYCETVLEQPSVDLNTAVNTTLKESEGEINAGLAHAKDHAKFYLRTVQPAIITNVSNISNYFALHDAVPASLPEGATEKEWVAMLQAMKEQADDYVAHSRDVSKMIGSFHDDLTTDVASFAKTATTMNAAVQGDNGVLAQLAKDIAGVQGKIDGAIAGIVLSGLAIAGGVFMVAIGALAEFVTGGAATALVVGGLTIVAAGVGGEVASALTLVALQKQQSEWLTNEKRLKEEVVLVQGMTTSFASLRDQARQAVAAATAMQNAWQFLSDDLGSLSGDLEKGIQNTGALRKLFLNASNTVVRTVITDTGIIKAQMTGIEIQKAGRTADGKVVNIADYTAEWARKRAA